MVFMQIGAQLSTNEAQIMHFFHVMFVVFLLIISMLLTFELLIQLLKAFTNMQLYLDNV